MKGMQQSHRDPVFDAKIKFGTSNLTIFYSLQSIFYHHDDVIKWKYLPRYWPFVRGIHRSPVNFPNKSQ